MFHRFAPKTRQCHCQLKQEKHEHYHISIGVADTGLNSDVDSSFFPGYR